MSFYHLKVVNKANKNIYVYDLSRDKVINDYLLKFLSRESFFIDGYNLNFDNIIQFKIVKTEENIKDTENQIRQQYYSQRLIIGMNEETIINNHRFSDEVTQELINECNNKITIEKDNIKSADKNYIFIVHGRERSKVEEVENFVRSIGYDPIVLFKEADNGLTIIEKIEKYTNESCFGIVIYTECDVGYLIGNPNDAKPRARQNVVFEHGYLMAKLGRKNVCALVESPSIEMPSDISGIIYKNYDANGLWKYSIAKDMIASNIKVDLNKIK